MAFLRSSILRGPETVRRMESSAKMTLQLGLFGSGFHGGAGAPGEPFRCLFWALNSAVECHLHTVEVAGSNPAAPTKSTGYGNVAGSCPAPGPAIEWLIASRAVL